MNVNRPAGRGARRFGAAVAAVSVALALAACSSGGADTSDGDAPTELIMSSVFDVTSWDPAINGDDFSAWFHQAVYSPLFQLQPDLTVSESIATEWSYDDAKTALTVTIKDGLKYSDGTALDADSVKANLERARDINGTSSAALAVIDSIDVSSPTEFTINLKSADPGLLFNLAREAGMMVSPKAFDTAKTAPVGYGPYLLDADKSTPGDTYVLTKNPDYDLATVWGFDEIDFKILSFDALTPALTSGQVDVAGVFPQTVDAVKGAGLGTVATAGQLQGLWLLDREGTLTPALKDPRVRQAMNYAVDGDTILATVEGGLGSSTTQMFAKGTPAYDESLNEEYPFDTAKAKQLLADAGYPDGFTIQMPNGGGSPLYAVYADQLAAVGITIEWVTVSEDQILTENFSGKYSAIAMGSWSPSDNWIDATQLLSPDGVYNTFHTDDPEVTDLLSQIAVAEGDEQAKLYQQLNAYIVDQAWFLPLYTTQSFIGYNADKVKVTYKAGDPVSSLFNIQPAD